VNGVVLVPRLSDLHRFVNLMILSLLFDILPHFADMFQHAEEAFAN